MTDVRKLLAILAALVLSAGGLAACGGDDAEDEPTPAATATETATEAPTEAATEAPAGEATTLEIDATEDGGLDFKPAELTAPAGTVTMNMASVEGNSLPHAVEVEGNGVEEAGDTVQAGGTSTVTAELQPGEYTYYCPVGNHRADGMEGTLTVE